MDINRITVIGFSIIPKFVPIPNIASPKITLCNKSVFREIYKIRINSASVDAIKFGKNVMNVLLIPTSKSI